MTVATEELVASKPSAARRMGERQFVEWVGEKTRAEWVNGEVVMMAPASGEHSDLALWLASVLNIFVEHRGLGVVRGPEYMVRLGNLRTRRVPDVLFVSKMRADILHPDHVEGAPDLIMEVVSRDSVSRDWREKYVEYEKAGVREYWIIDPLARRMEAHSLLRRKYQVIEEKNGVVNSTVLPGFHIKPAWLFNEPRARIVKVLRELGVA